MERSHSKILLRFPKDSSEIGGLRVKMNCKAHLLSFSLSQSETEWKCSMKLGEMTAEASTVDNAVGYYYIYCTQMFVTWPLCCIHEFLHHTTVEPYLLCLKLLRVQNVVLQSILVIPC